MGSSSSVLQLLSWLPLGCQSKSCKRRWGGGGSVFTVRTCRDEVRPCDDESVIVQIRGHRPLFAHGSTELLQCKTSSTDLCRHSSLTSSVHHAGSEDIWPAGAEEAASASSAEDLSPAIFPVGASRGAASPDGAGATDLEVEAAPFWFLPGGDWGRERGRGI